MTRHEELIARLEASSGDRELDAAIWKLVDFDNWNRECSFAGKKYAGHVHTPAEKREHEMRVGQRMAKPYTSSIDAARTLLEPGYVAVNLSINEHGQSSARICPPYVYGNGATPAIALCVASLRARASLKARTAQK